MPGEPDVEEAPHVEITPPPDVTTLRDVQALITAGRRDEAIGGLEKLRRTSPKNPYLAYLLGNLYFQRKWWTDGLESYEAAIQNNRSYRARAPLIKNAIVALSSSKTAPKAHRLLVRQIGGAAAPYLRWAARNDPSPTVRARAAAALRQVGRR